jgi:hypothetical protein
MRLPKTHEALLVAALLGFGLTVTTAWAARSAAPTVVGFEDAGPGPRSVTLTITRDGRASLTHEGSGPSGARTFRITPAMVRNIETELASARPAEAKPSYGMPNPGGVFSVVTVNGRSVTVYASAAAPALLRQLIATLGRIVDMHQ